ncbi:argininosuccinate lyase, partial [Acinetobacter baumannii]
KEAIFDLVDTVKGCLRVTATVLRNARLNEERARTAAMRGYMNATELADYLVRKGMPFRDAHEATGRMVLAALERGVV